MSLNFIKRNAPNLSSVFNEFELQKFLDLSSKILNHTFASALNRVAFVHKL